MKCRFLVISLAYCEVVGGTNNESEAMSFLQDHDHVVIDQEEGYWWCGRGETQTLREIDLEPRHD